MRRAFIGLALLATILACGTDDEPHGQSATTVPTTPEVIVGGGSDGAAGVVTDATIEVDGRDRLYRLVVPTTVDPSVPVPLVLVLHGNGTDRNSFPERTGFDDVAEREGFLLVYPEADASTRGVWNGGFSARSGDVDDVGFLRALVGAIGSSYEIDPDRVFATGLSGGGMMSYRLACEAPDLVAAVAPVGATMVVDCDPTLPVSVLHLHGMDDESIPIDGREDREFPPVAEVMETWSRLDGCDAEPAVRREGASVITSWSGCDAGSAVQFYAIDGVGHDYPRADEGAPVDAREVVWDFFVAHPRAG